MPKFKTLLRFQNLWDILESLGGFITNMVLIDMEIKKVKDRVGLVETNTTVAYKHM